MGSHGTSGKGRGTTVDVFTSHLAGGRALALACLVLVLPSQALALRCGNNVVDVGATRIEVLKKCGEPTLVDEWDEEETFRRSTEIDRLGERKRRTVFVHVEQWVYNFGPTRFIYLLKFRNGVLAEITTGDHGY